MNSELNAAQNGSAGWMPALCVNFPDEYRREHVLAGRWHA